MPCHRAARPCRERAGLADETQTSRPNVLIITVDDMNWNSVGAFGSPIEDITPHIDALARSGRRYERAYVAASNCAPSRVALQTGLTPEQSGATGFFYIDDRDTLTIATELRKASSLTGIIGKPADSNPSPGSRRYWDVQENSGAARKYAAAAIAEASARFFGSASSKGKPIYLVVNIADPHKPNFNDAGAAASGADAYPRTPPGPGRLCNVTGLRVLAST